MAASSETRRLVALLGAMRRHHPDVDTGRIEADLKASQLLDRIRDDVATAPPIPMEARTELAALLLRQPASGAPPGPPASQSATGGFMSAEAVRPPGHPTCPASGETTRAEAGDAA